MMLRVTLLDLSSLSFFIIIFGKSDASCFKNTTQPCCNGYFMSEVDNFCVASCDDFENCTGYQKCREGRFDDYTVNYAEAEQFNIEYCDEITGNFHCDVGYYTNATTLIIEQAVCKDFCPPGKTDSRSCSALIEDCAEFCHIENVDSSKDENWCNLEQRSCVCKKGYKQPNCEKCPPDKTGDNCSRDCKIECGNIAGATCDGPTCLCPPGFQNQANQCRQCDNGFYGQDCAGTCISSREDACYEAHSFSRLSPEKCDKVTGSCICVPGFDPAENCQSACKEFMWGGGEDNCQSCSCKNLMECDRITGECLCGEYLTGTHCETTKGVCPSGMSGAKCDIKCNCSPGENCTREDQNKCQCIPDDIIDEHCQRKPTTSDSLPSTTPGVPGSQLHMSSPHLEYLVMAGVLAAGMIMGVSVIGCYKLCCRRGSYVEPPSKSGEIRYRVKDDLVFLCVKNSKFKGQDPQVLIPSILDSSNISQNGAGDFCSSMFDLPPCGDHQGGTANRHTPYRDAPGLAGQLVKNELSPDNKMIVQLPGVGKDHKPPPQKVSTIRNDYTDVNDMTDGSTSSSYRPRRVPRNSSTATGYTRPPLPVPPSATGNPYGGSERPLSSGSGGPVKVTLSPPSGPSDTYCEVPNYVGNEVYGYNNGFYGSARNQGRIQSDFSRPVDLAEYTNPSSSSAVYDYEPQQQYYGSSLDRPNDIYNEDDSVGLLKIKTKQS